MIMNNAYFTNNVKFKDFDFYRDFWLLISTGNLPTSMQNFLFSESFLKDLKAANIFVDEFFP